MHLLGPSGGYLLSYIPVSYLIGKCFEKYNQASWSQSVAIIASGNVVNILCGTIWLSAFMGLENGWKLGAYPFLATCFMKTLIVASLIPALNKNVKGFFSK